MTAELEPVAWVTVRVEDTCDGLLINAEDMKRFGLHEDHQYEGKFLPDGRYQIAVPPLPVARKARALPDAAAVTLSSAQEAMDKREERIRELERINTEHCKAVNTYIILNARLEDRAVAAEQEVERLKERASDFGDKIREAAYHVWPHAEDVGEDADFIILEIGGERDLAEARAEAAEARASALQALLDEVGEVLEPFARYRTADGIMGMDGRTHFRVPDGHMLLGNMNNAGDLASVDPETVVTVGDLRAARSLAAKIKEAKG